MFIYMGGFHLVFAVHQQQLKREMRTYLQAHNDERYGSHFVFQLHNNKVNDPAFEWEEENQEFRYKSELYDVVSVTIQGNELKVTALKDSNENQLEQQVNQLNKDRNNKTTAPASALKFFSVCCDIPTEEYSLHKTSSTTFYHFYRANACDKSREILTPPPRC
jgi:hypothetical protein